jgi:putative membrane protein
MESLLSLIRPAGIDVYLLGFWILVMIMVPVVRWTLGSGAEKIGITAGVFAQVAAVVAALASGTGLWVIVAVVAVPVFGWASEVLGSRSGFPFGPYHYTDVLQPQVSHVPVLIPLAWLMMMPPAWAVGSLLAPESDLLRWLIAALAFTAWDVYLDPMMVNWGFWKWERNGAYLGIPLVNFAGWFLVAFVITAAIGSIGLAGGPDMTMPARSGPLVLIYLVTWPLMLVGQLLFWRLRVSAVAGFIAMGAFTVPVLLRLL